MDEPSIKLAMLKAKFRYVLKSGILGAWFLKGCSNEKDEKVLILQGTFLCFFFQLVLYHFPWVCYEISV